jgi:hypothetical protein
MVRLLHIKRGLVINGFNNRVFLVEGLVTIIFGVVLFFLLPDCKSSLISPEAKLTDVSSSNSQMAHRKGKSFCASQITKQCTSTSREKLQFPGNHHLIERCQDVAFHLLLGNLHSWDFRAVILPTYCGS